MPVALLLGAAAVLGAPLWVAVAAALWVVTPGSGAGGSERWRERNATLQRRWAEMDRWISGKRTPGQAGGSEP